MKTLKLLLLKLMWDVYIVIGNSPGKYVEQALMPLAPPFLIGSRGVKLSE